MGVVKDPDVARRIARAVVSDIALYNAKKVEEGIGNDTLFELLREEIGGHVEVYACGPPAMLDAVETMCHEAGVPGQLAMESGMACGFGACFGCVVRTKDGYVRLCVDGPVI